MPASTQLAIDSDISKTGPAAGVASGGGGSDGGKIPACWIVRAKYSSRRELPRRSAAQRAAGQAEYALDVEVRSTLSLARSYS